MKTKCETPKLAQPSSQTEEKLYRSMDRILRLEHKSEPQSCTQRKHKLMTNAQLFVVVILRKCLHSPISTTWQIIFSYWLYNKTKDAVPLRRFL